MHALWPVIAHNIVQGLDVQPGELIQVRGDPGSLEILQEILLAVEVAGATPLVEITGSDYLARLWRHAPPDYLANWDQHRQHILGQVDRVVTIGGAAPDTTGLPDGALEAWSHATQRLMRLEETRQLPVLLVASPTAQRARQLGLSHAELEAIVLPALAATASELQHEIERVLALASDSRQFTIHTGDGHVLHLDQGDRAWLGDDGIIDTDDRVRGAVVSNLPAGSIYTTVRETETHGRLWLPRAGAAEDVLLTFEGGRIVTLEAAHGAETLIAWLDGHSGESRRVSHIGIGLNPYLTHPIGWTLVDEHVHGALFIALGENRYMGGQNESSLNVDFALLDATFVVGEQAIVVDGKVGV